MYFPYFQHFATKLCNSTNIKTLLLAAIKILLIMPGLKFSHRNYLLGLDKTTVIRKKSCQIVSVDRIQKVLLKKTN